MEPHRKVNWKNITIVFIVTVIGLVVGLYDRIVNHVRPIEDFYVWFVSIGSNTYAKESADIWYNTTGSLNTYAASSFDLWFILPIVIVGIGIMSLVVSTFGFAARA